MTSLDLRTEINRKLIHLSSLWMVACIYWLVWWQAAALFFLLFVVLLCYEWLRYRNMLPEFIARMFQNLLRSGEIAGFRLTGASWMLLAAFLCVILFDRYIAFAAMLVLIISDSCAALVGKLWGSVPLFGKSLQGTLAFAVAAWLCILITVKLFALDYPGYVSSLIPAIVVAIVELVSGRLKLDDNLTIPLSMGLVLSVMS